MTPTTDDWYATPLGQLSLDGMKRLTPTLYALVRDAF